MNDLMTTLQERVGLLDKSVSRLSKNGEKLAIAERTFRVALAKKILELRDAGMPVSITETVAKGEETIATLRQERDIAEAVYEANKEHINAVKIEIRVLENIIGREWGK